jgi:hypothetical protein
MPDGGYSKRCIGQMPNERLWLGRPALMPSNTLSAATRRLRPNECPDTPDLDVGAPRRCFRIRRQRFVEAQDRSQPRRARQRSGDCIRGVREAGVARPPAAELTDAALERLLYRSAAPVEKRRPEPDWATVHRELKRAGLMLQLPWEEYRAAHPDGRGYSRYVAIRLMSRTERRRCGRPLLETDASLANLDGTNKCFAFSGTFVSLDCRAHTDAFGTVTGRVGWAFGPFGRSLLHGKGGLA